MLTYMTNYMHARTVAHARMHTHAHTHTHTHTHYCGIFSSIPLCLSCLPFVWRLIFLMKTATLGLARVLLSTMANCSKPWDSPVLASGHVMQKPAGVPSIKDQLGHLRDQLCSEIDHTESSERSETLPVRSESFSLFSLKLQRGASEKAGWGRCAQAPVFDRHQSFG